MTAITTDLIERDDDPQLGELGTHSIIADLRNHFPATDSPRNGGNHTIAAEVRARLTPATVAELCFDPEYSCLYVYGDATGLTHVVAALNAMKSDGWGATTPAG